MIHDAAIDLFLLSSLQSLCALFYLSLYILFLITTRLGPLAKHLLGAPVKPSVPDQSRFHADLFTATSPRNFKLDTNVSRHWSFELRKGRREGVKLQHFVESLALRPRKVIGADWQSFIQSSAQRGSAKPRLGALPRRRLALRTSVFPKTTHIKQTINQSNKQTNKQQTNKTKSVFPRVQLPHARSCEHAAAQLGRALAAAWYPLRIIKYHNI